MKKRHNLCCTALALPFQTLRRASQARLELFLPALPFDTPRQASMACLASSLPAPPFQMLGRASQARLASVLPVPPFHTPRRACEARLVFLLPPPSISTHQMSHDGSSGVLIAPHISSHPDEPRWLVWRCPCQSRHSIHPDEPTRLVWCSYHHPPPFPHTRQANEACLVFLSPPLTAFTPQTSYNGSSDVFCQSRPFLHPDESAWLVWDYHYQSCPSIHPDESAWLVWGCHYRPRPSIHQDELRRSGSSLPAPLPYIQTSQHLSSGPSTHPDKLARLVWCLSLPLHLLYHRKDMVSFFLPISFHLLTKLFKFFELSIM